MTLQAVPCHNCGGSGCVIHRWRDLDALSIIRLWVLDFWDVSHEKPIECPKCKGKRWLAIEVETLERK